MDNEKLISPYIPAQFPFHYRENYPQLVEFVKMYYSSLEQEGETLWHARRLQEYRDIDEIPEDYIGYFKSKYLPYIKFVTETDKRTLVKHVQDLYRSKGTERGIDLFFRLVYGVPAEVYYPAVDLFRLSDNTWVKRKYLELGHSEITKDFVGKKVIGTRSGATAFAERYVQKKVGNAYVNLLFISSIEGSFRFNEKITYDGLDTKNRNRPRIIGSLSRLVVTTGSRDFSVGDVVDVYSDRGKGAKARVASVFNTTGLVDFVLEDGGWGYSNNANVYVSEKILSLQNVVIDFTVNNPDKAPYVASPFFTLEKVYQPLANLDYKFDTSYQNIIVTKPASVWYSNGAVVYQTNSTVNVAVGTIVSNSSITGNTTAQNLVVSVAKSNTNQVDFLLTSTGISNLYLSTNSSVNSAILSVNVSTNTFSVNVGTVLRSYNSTGGVISSVQVISSAIDNVAAATANLFVHVTSGNAEVNTYFWAPSNTYSINVSNYTDRTATANVIGFSNTLTMYVSNSTMPFSANQYLTQRRTYSGGYDISARGRITSVVGAGNTFTIGLDDATGVFRQSVNVYMQFANGSESENTAYLDSYNGYVGVANITNEFSAIGNNRIYTRGYTYDANSEMIIYGSNSTANLVALSSGKNATLEVTNTFSYQESYSLFTDFVGANNDFDVPFMDLQFVNSAVYPTGYTLTFAANTDVLEVSGGTASINLDNTLWVSGIGISDFTEVLSKNSTHITVNQNTWSSSSGDYYFSLANGISWGFPLNPSGTIQNDLDEILEVLNGYVGGLTKIVAENPGEDYTVAPMVLIKDPYTSGFTAKDYIITYVPDFGNFTDGERVSQTEGAIGLIKSITIGPTKNIMYVRRQSLPLGNSSVSTSFSVGDIITGTSTGANGTIIGVSEDDSALGVGLNAIVSSNVITGNGVVKTLDILASGYGFENNENATFISKDGLRAGTAKVRLINEGTTDGVFMDEASFLSDSKYLYDGDYYQEFSYDIKTSLPRDTYERNYDATMHLVGTKMFSTYVHVAKNDMRMTVSLPEESANLIANVT